MPWAETRGGRVPESSVPPQKMGANEIITFDIRNITIIEEVYTRLFTPKCRFYSMKRSCVQTSSGLTNG